MKSTLFSIALLLLMGSVSTALAEKKKEAEVDGLKVGDKAPDFEIIGIGDKKIKLSDRFGKKGKNVVILFSRASW